MTTPQIDAEFRRVFLEWRLLSLSSVELTDWLRELRQPTHGNLPEKSDRIRAHSTYPTLEPSTFREEFLDELRRCRADELVELCKDLAIESRGTKHELARRCYRELAYREGWLPRVDSSARTTLETVLPFIDWYPVLVRSDREKDHYAEFEDEMSEVFGGEKVHDQHPVPFGVELKIDFHIGDPLGAGVGVEFKLPSSNSDIQKAVGQVTQYTRVYGPQLVVVILPQKLRDDRAIIVMAEQLRQIGVAPVVKDT